MKKGTNAYALVFERSGKKESIESIEIHNGDGFVIAPPPEVPTLPQPTSLPTATSAEATASGTATLPTSLSATGSSDSGSMLPSGTVTETGASGNTRITATTETPEPILPKKIPVPVDDGKLYFKNGTPVKLVLRSLSPKTEISDISKEIVAGLRKIGFAVQFEEVESSSESLLATKNYESKNYDIFITGINLGYLGTYIMPYFHSGQAQNGFNFSLVRNPALDIFLEELKTKDLPIEGRTRTFEKINDILKKESVLVPIGTSPLVSFIDKNIQDFNTPAFLPSAVFIDNAILRSYINKTYIVQFEKKTVRGFFDWCSARLFPTP